MFSALLLLLRNPAALSVFMALREPMTLQLSLIRGTKIIATPGNESLVQSFQNDYCKALHIFARHAHNTILTREFKKLFCHAYALLRILM